MHAFFSYEKFLAAFRQPGRLVVDRVVLHEVRHELVPVVELALGETVLFRAGLVHLLDKVANVAVKILEAQRVCVNCVDGGKPLGRDALLEDTDAVENLFDLVDLGVFGTFHVGRVANVQSPRDVVGFVFNDPMYGVLEPKEHGACRDNDLACFLVEVQRVRFGGVEPPLLAAAARVVRLVELLDGGVPLVRLGDAHEAALADRVLP